MAFTVDQLLLKDDRKAQLIAALAGTGQADPLGKCISEAVADVVRLTKGYVVDQDSLDGWTRNIALWKAYTAAENEMPANIKDAHDSALKELSAIAAGQRPNLPRVELTNAPAVSTGQWGGNQKIQI